MKTINDADLVLNIVDLSEMSDISPSEHSGLRVGSKLDLIEGEVDPSLRFDVLVSSSTGAGLNELRALLLKAVRSSTNVGSLAIPSRMRHADRLRSASQHLQSALDGVSYPLELRAEDLRLASVELARVTGRIDTETLLGKIFSEFCVGK